MKYSLFVLGIILVGCAPQNYSPHHPEVDKNRLNSYKFDYVELTVVGSTQTRYNGQYFVERGYRSWTFTMNSISTKYISPDIISSTTYKGDTCSTQDLYTKQNGELTTTTLLICNRGTHAYHLFENGVIHFFNMPPVDSLIGAGQ